MTAFWSVAWHEYKRNVFKKSFIFVLLSVPFFISVMVGMGLFLENSEDNPLPVGYVDQVGVISSDAIVPEIQDTWIDEYDDRVEFIAYTTEEDAQEALQAGVIQAYNIIPADYLLTRHIKQVYIEGPGENADRQFFDYLQLNLASGKSPEIAFRVAAGTDVIVRSLDGSRVAPKSGPTFGLLMPLFIAMAFLFMIIMSSGYTMSAIADEKENRVMEILVTSVSPIQLIGGKIMGIVAISFTLLGSWALVTIFGIFTAGKMGVAWFSDLSMDLRIIFSAIAIAIPAYVLAAALMTAIGSMVSTVQEGQSVSAIFFILHIIPLYVSWIFLNEPHGTLAVLLSFLPFTALMTVGMRNLFTIVPTWQVLVSVLVQIVFALGALWLASRAFRLGMLRYGQRLMWGKLFRKRSTLKGS